MTDSSSTLSRQQQTDPLLTEAITRVRAGNGKRAQNLLTRVLQENPDNAQAWLLLATTSRDPRRAKSYVRQALRIEPRNRRAIRGLRQIEEHLAREPVLPAKRPAQPLRRWLGIWLLIAAVAVILGGFVGQARATRHDTGTNADVPAVQPSPSATATATATATPTLTISDMVVQRLPELERAWQARDWQGAIEVLGGIAVLDGQYPGLRLATCDTYVHWARDLVTEGQIKQAHELYRRAYPVCQENTDLAGEKELALTYLSGKWKYDRQRWQAAATTLQAVYDARPDYAQVRPLLYTSYISSSHELLAEHRLSEAKKAAQAALTLEPSSSEATSLLNQIRARQVPTPVPVVTGGKRIEVNISEQRMYVWQGNTLVYKWVCSTGEPGRNTATGRFSILDKYPEAWASTWNLRMPYWMGIYWAGSLENGIHALPINPDGSILWEGYLGTRVSYGCIILSTQNARTLYNWAPIGTPVWIHY